MTYQKLHMRETMSRTSINMSTSSTCIILHVVEFAVSQMIVDSTLSISRNTPDALTEKLSSSYRKVSDYMTSNELKLNDDKTHLLLMTTAQKRKHLTQELRIITTNEVIQASSSEKLLGVTIHENLKWTEYILNDEKSLTAQLSLRLNGLKKVSRAASFKSRLTIANRILCQN